jgi:uncharacterized YigZ family protein
METKSKDTDIYYTIDKRERAEIKIKGSRFIASAAHAAAKEDAMAFVDKIRAEFHDATHNCFAYRIGPDGMEFRAVDDGEPSGTAGKPILFSIKKFDLSDCAVVVTRYYGGVKLGVGGLARAYSDSAVEALSLCEKKPVYRTMKIKVFCTYEDISVIKKLVDQTAVSFDEIYHDAVEITADIPLSKSKSFMALVTSSTRGRAGTVVVR